MSKAKIFAVRNRAVDPQAVESVRLVRAHRRAQVESFILGDFEIAPATADECVEAGALGIKVEEAGNAAE